MCQEMTYYLLERRVLYFLLSKVLVGVISGNVGIIDVFNGQTFYFPCHVLTHK